MDIRNVLRVGVSSVLLSGCSSGVVVRRIPVSTVTPNVYGTKQFGYDRTNWEVICKEPARAYEPIAEEVLHALEREGWLVPGRLIPSAEEVNTQCKDLGF